MQKIIINLPVHEWEALINLAEREHRPTQYQAELIFRNALIQHGIIKTPTKQVEKKSKQRDQFPNAQPT